MDVTVLSLVCSALTMLTLVDTKNVSVVWKNKGFLWNMMRARRAFGTLNQLFLIMVKEQMGIPYTLDETPWKTYGDVKRVAKERGNYWPYLSQLDSTTTPQQLLTDQIGTSVPVVNFSSYSYVGALREQEILDFTIEQLKQGHYTFGNHGPRMLGGNNYWIDMLEKKLASFTGREAALVFSSGFLACKTVIQALAGKGDVIFGDGRLHESLKDGIRCATQRGAKTFTFRHNQFAQLEDLLKKYRKSFRRAYLIVESVYSMDGDFTDLVICKRLANQYDLKIILDEAHGLGILGPTGRGLEEVQNCKNTSWLIVGSLTKALGSVGGYVCGPQEIIDFLHFFATGTMFSAPLSIPNCIAAYKTIEMIDTHPEWMRETNQNMDTLRTLLLPLERKHQIVAQSRPGSPLVALILRDFHSMRVFAVAEFLRNQGFYVAAVNPPACPLREPRLRLTAPRGISEAQIRSFVQALDQALERTRSITNPIDIQELTRVTSYFGI